MCVFCIYFLGGILSFNKYNLNGRPFHIAYDMRYGYDKIQNIDPTRGCWTNENKKSAIKYIKRE